MDDVHDVRVETRETDTGIRYVAHCVCGWAGRDERSAERAEVRGTVHTLMVEARRAHPPDEVVEAPPEEAETDYEPAVIDLSDALKVVSWLGSARVYAIMKVGDRASVMVSGPLCGGRAPDWGGIDIRIQGGPMRATLEIANEPFVSAQVCGKIMEIQFSESRITLISSAMQEAWRHVQISKQWLAEQPDVPDPPSGEPRLRRIGYR